MIDKRTDVTVVGVLYRRASGQRAISITGTGIIRLTVGQLAGSLDSAQLRSLKCAFKRAVIRRARGERGGTADLHPQRPGPLYRFKAYHIGIIQYRISLTGNDKHGYRWDDLKGRKRRHGGHYRGTAIGRRHTGIIGRGACQPILGHLPLRLGQADGVRVVHRCQGGQFKHIGSTWCSRCPCDDRHQGNRRSSIARRSDAHLPQGELPQVAGIVPLVEAACYHAPPIGTRLKPRHLGQGATHRIHLDLSHKHIHLLIGKNLHHIVDAITIPLQGREFRYFTAVLGIEQDGLGGLTGHNTRHHWSILILPTVENGHGIAVTFPLVFRQRVRRPVTHAVDILLLAAEVLVLHAIGDGIDDIAHIGNAVPRERAVAIGKIGDRLIGLVGSKPGRSGIQRYRRVEAVLEPCAQLTHLAVDDLLLVSPRAVAEIDHTRIATCCHRLAHDTSLLDKLGKRPSLLIGNPLADEDVAVETRRHLAPPRRDTGKRARRLPINLRSQEIDGAARHPSHRVAVNLVILPIAAHRTRLHAIFVGYSLRSACHTGRTDAEAHPGLGRLDHVIDILDHLVDILAPPVAL